MSEYKYPWIPREYYPAVMRVVEDYGDSQDEERLNQLINLYSTRFWVDHREVAKHVKIRLRAERNIPSWFIVVKVVWKNGEPSYMDPWIYSGFSAESVEDRFFNRDWRLNMHYVYISEDSIVVEHKAIAEFATREEAVKVIPMWEALAEKYEAEDKSRRTAQ